MSPSGKVVTTLRDRLALERQVRELLESRSEEEFAGRARRIAESGDQVVPVIVHNLAHTDPRQLNALGVVASLYPLRGEILNKLYEVAGDVERPDKERVSALLILERFLDQTPDPYLLQTLDDPRAVAIESVKDIVRASEEDPSVLIEYTRALSEQPAETVVGVIDTLIEVAEERAVVALCLMSQDGSELLSGEALSSLGQIRHPEAVRGLQALIPVLPPARRRLGEQSLQKLRLGGLPVAALPEADPSWRALISPVDGQGGRVVWFIHDPDEHGKCHFLGLSLNEGEGIAQAYGNHNVPSQALPGRGRPGHVHRVPMKPVTRTGGETVVLHMLESDLDHGRRLVQGAQTKHFELGRALPAAYRLLSPLIWQYDAASIETSRQMPPKLVHTLDLLPQTASLPYHPFFQGWFVGGPRVMRIAETMVSLAPSGDQEVLHAWAVRLAEEHFDEATVRRTEARLAEMSEWLWRAEQVHLVELVMVAAETIAKIPPAQHPLALGMAELGINLAVYSLHSSQTDVKEN